MTIASEDLDVGRRQHCAGLAAAIALIAVPSTRSPRRQRRGRDGWQRHHAAHRRPTTPGAKAKLKNGFAVPPASAPRKVVRAIEAANEIVKGKPYCMGGGHARRVDRATTARAPSATRSPAPGCSTPRCPRVRSWAAPGEGRQGPVDHHLRQRGSHLRGDRRPAPRHLDDHRRRTRLEHGDALVSGFVARHPTGL